VKSDLTTEIVNVDLEQALKETSRLISLKEDVVTVYSILDFVEEYKITIDGEIKSLVFMIITKV
jgi:hypothetical protein